jgi:hypothetical protein
MYNVDQIANAHSTFHATPCARMERQRSSWPRMLAIVLFVASGVAYAGGGTTAPVIPAAMKVSDDLSAVVAAATTPKISWAKDVAGVRYVKALIIVDAASNATKTRDAVLHAGGSVYYRYTSVPALSVLMPASSVTSIAARTEVQSISPNRLAARTASSIEFATGALAANVRTYAGTTYSGLDGTGVGIAIVDSGVMFNHQNLGDDRNATRVVKGVDMTKAGDASLVGAKDWTPGIDASSDMSPGSTTQTQYENKIQNTKHDNTDLYGHGTHVASVAAGRGT